MRFGHYRENNNGTEQDQKCSTSKGPEYRPAGELGFRAAHNTPSTVRAKTKGEAFYPITTLHFRSRSVRAWNLKVK